jgi:hypothetical protein
VSIIQGIKEAQTGGDTAERMTYSVCIFTLPKATNHNLSTLLFKRVEKMSSNE